MADTDDSGLMDQTKAMFVILSFCHPDVGPAQGLVHWKLQHRFVHVARLHLFFVSLIFQGALKTSRVQSESVELYPRIEQSMQIVPF